MAWNASHLFVRCSDASQVQQALEGLLLDDGHQVDLEGFEDPPGPAVVCPPHQGWVAVTGAGAWIDDLPWAAEELSRACDELAASLEVFGNCYRLRLCQCRAGNRERLLCSPEGGWRPGAEEPARMPLYEDVEQLAFSTLVELGVPPALTAVGTRPFGCTGDALELGEGVTLGRRGAEIERGALELALAPFDGGDDAPVVPTRVGEDFGLMIFEDRYLEGEPADASLARLIEIEEAFTARAKRTRREGNVSSTFTYYGGPHQERLDTLLRAQSRHTLPAEHRFRPPWWQFWRYLGRLR